MKCVLCNKEIEKVGGYDGGNNAQPLADGRCCGECNTFKVIPERIRRFKQ